MRPLTVPLLDEINLDTAFSIYKDRFADFSDFVFLFVGKLQSLIPSNRLLSNILPQLPSLNRKEMWKDIGVMPPKRSHQ